MLEYLHLYVTKGFITMKKIKALIAVIAFAVSSSLYAHGMMTGTYPVDDFATNEPIERVEINFGKPMALISLKLTDSSGKPVDIDFKRSKEVGLLFTTALPTLKPDVYTVDWKALGSDGHMTKGSFGFTQL
jgi:methionine-rich copper-binding protein CopC